MAEAFDTARRERFLTLRETGRSIKDAAEQTPISRGTVYNWLEAGKDKRDAESIEFLERHAAIVDAGLDEKDLIYLLELKARQGSVQAVKLLLEKPWKKQKEPEAPKLDLFDELATKRNSKVG